MKIQLSDVHIRKDISLQEIDSTIMILEASKKNTKDLKSIAIKSIDRINKTTIDKSNYQYLLQIMKFQTLVEDADDDIYNYDIIILAYKKKKEQILNAQPGGDY